MDLILHTEGLHILADSALAFAANTYGIKSVSIETSISHTKVVTGDICCYTKEINRPNKLKIYYVTIKNQDDIEVAILKEQYL